MRTDQIHAFVDQFEADFRNRTRFQLYRNDNRPITLEEAYEIQAEILTRALRSGTDSVAGYKVGLTTGKMQKFCGVDQPIAGRILKSGVHPSGARLRKSNFHRLGIESELALRIGKEIPAGADAEREVLACIDAIAAAFEVIDDRDADYAHLEASSIAAENSWNRGIVLAGVSDRETLGAMNGQPIVHVFDQPRRKPAVSHCSLAALFSRWCACRRSTSSESSVGSKPMSGVDRSAKLGMRGGTIVAFAVVVDAEFQLPSSMIVAS